jgi:4-aminobutyrate aminotransferase-like enzyme
VLFTYYREPLQIVEGHMQYLWDQAGKRYLDAAAGIATVSVGHCHPRVTEAIRTQVGKLVHTTTIYLHPNIARYAKLLAEHFPEDSGLSSTYFTNSGSESNELAVLVARLHTGSYDVISLRNGYHGGSAATMGLTGMGNWKYPLPQSFGVHYASPGYCYRCPARLTYPECGLRCAHDVEEMISCETAGRVAAFIAEPIQGVGGVVEPPPGFFKIVYEIVRAHGGICISDEVQAGFAAHRRSFLGLRASRGCARHCHHGQGHRQRRSARCGDHASPGGGGDARPSAFQHLRRQPGFDDSGNDDARGDRSGCVAGERAGGRRSLQVAACSNCRSVAR